MVDDSNKRKGGPGGDRGHLKKSKGGGNKWKTPNQVARQAAQVEQGTKLGIGDAGIWVTYARGQRPRAVREFIDLCEVYGQEMYGIKPFHAEDKNDDEDDEEEGGDIEASIQKELSSMTEKKSRPQDRAFTSINTGIECVFFLKTRAPVNAAELTLRICRDAREGSEPKGSVRCRYINRLVPVVDVDRSTEGGMERVGREVLGKEFHLRKPGGEEKEEGKEEEEEEANKEFCTYAIRNNIRHNKELPSGDLIKRVAGLVDERHKVNLTKPDKVILVEVFQLYCGMSVVDGKEWESLKRYNVNEMYRLARQDGQKKVGGEKLGVEAGEEKKKEEEA